MFSSDNSIGGFHNDVLDAVPIDDESSLKLIEEIKNRAKGSISSQNYPVAITLYSKAIDICPPTSKGARAILLSNRSLCHFSMSNLDSAIDDADNSILADSSYLKVSLSFFCFFLHYHAIHCHFSFTYCISCHDIRYSCILYSAFARFWLPLLQLLYGILTDDISLPFYCVIICYAHSVYFLWLFMFIITQWNDNITI